MPYFYGTFDRTGIWCETVCACPSFLPDTQPGVSDCPATSLLGFFWENPKGVLNTRGRNLHLEKNIHFSQNGKYSSGNPPGKYIHMLKYSVELSGTKWIALCLVPRLSCVSHPEQSCLCGCPGAQLLCCPGSPYLCAQTSALCSMKNVFFLLCPARPLTIITHVRECNLSFSFRSESHSSSSEMSNPSPFLSSLVKIHFSSLTPSWAAP